MKPTTVTPQKKKRGPPPTGKGQMLGVRLQPPDLSRLDIWIARQPAPRPTRPEAIRRLVEKGLASEGVAAGPDAGSIPLESLNASNDE
jgi:hypothetical protein